MRNFFYAPIVALLLILGSCADSDVDDGTGEVEEGVDAVFLTHPGDVTFDTNFERWDTQTVSFTVDPGDYRIHRGSFSMTTSDYFTTTVQAGDEDNEYSIRFTTTSAAEALTDSLEVEITMLMTFNGFTQVAADPFKVILPADKYSPYYINQPSGSTFKAGFVAGDYCDVSFDIEPMDAIDSITFALTEENSHFSVEFFDGDSLNSYFARFYATQDLVDYAANALTYYTGVPAYAENLKWGDNVAINMITTGVEVEEPEVFSDEFFVIAELMNVAPTFVGEVPTVDFGNNFDLDEIATITFEVDPGTKNISRTSFEITTSDMYEFYSFASGAFPNTYELRLKPTELSVGDILGDDSTGVMATIKMTYDNYGDTLYVDSQEFAVSFGEDYTEMPWFDEIPEVVFPVGFTTDTEVTVTTTIDDGTLSLTADSMWYVDNGYFTATFAGTSIKHQYEVTFKATDAAVTLARGSETNYISSQLALTCYDDIYSAAFDIAFEGRLVFDHYLYRLTHNSVICNVAEFASTIDNDDILEKGVAYSTSSSTDDMSTWTEVPVRGLNGNGTRYAYVATVGDLTPGTTYYLTPYVKQDGLTSYGSTTSFTTYASADATPKQGNSSWSWGTTTTDATATAAVAAAMDEAISICNIYTATMTSFKVAYDATASETITTTSLITFAPNDISVGRALNSMSKILGVGTLTGSSWTSTMNTAVSGVYYCIKSYTNAIYNLLSNQTGERLTSSATALDNYGLESDPGNATAQDIIEHGEIMSNLVYDGLGGVTLTPGYTTYASFVPVTGINVALNKTVTASNGQTTANYAVDGYRSSDSYRWTTSGVTYATLEIELGAYYEIKGFNYYNGSNGYNSIFLTYSFQYWNDGTNSWTDAYSETNSIQSGYGYQGITLPTPITANRVRLNVTSFSSIGLYEIEVMTDYIR